MVKQIKKDNMRTTIVIFTDHHAGIIYFKNPEDAEKAIKILGKEVLNLF